MKKHAVPLLLLLLISLFCMRALFHPGLFTAHDIWHQVARLYWYVESTKAGAFPPHWIAPMANGFGYPLFVFSYHFPWMVGLLFISFGLSVIETLKILFVLSFVVSGWGMYWASFLFTRNKVASFVSGILYVIAPWRFVTILVSAAMGKAFVPALFPLIIVSLYYTTKSKKWIVGSFALGVTVSALILTHLISLITLLAILLPFVLYLKTPIRRLMLAGIVTILLSAWYVFPLVNLSSQIQASAGQFKSLYLTQFVSLKQLIYSPWGYGIVQQNAKEGAFSYQLGFAQWVAILFSCTMLFYSRDKKLSALLLAAFVLCIFLMLDVSKPLWNVVSAVITIDYPTMFLMPALFIAAFLSGLLILNLKRSGLFVGVLFVVLAMLNNRNYMRVNEYINASVTDVVASEITTNSFNEYLPLTGNATIMSKNTASEIEGEGIVITNINRSPSRYNASFSKITDGEVILKVFSFPGLRVFLDGEPMQHNTSKTGQITLFVKAGEHTITVFYESVLY